MNPKQIDVTCPCCRASLTVDVLTSAVLRWARPAERDETGKVVLDEGRWDQATGRVRERGTRAADTLDAALDRERSRDADLDDLFDKARRKLRRPRDPQQE